MAGSHQVNLAKHPSKESATSCWLNGNVKKLKVYRSSPIAVEAKYEAPNTKRLKSQATGWMGASNLLNKIVLMGVVAKKKRKVLSFSFAQIEMGSPPSVTWTTRVRKTRDALMLQVATF